MSNTKPLNKKTTKVKSKNTVNVSQPKPNDKVNEKISEVENIQKQNINTENIVNETIVDQKVRASENANEHTSTINNQEQIKESDNKKDAPPIPPQSNDQKNSEHNNHKNNHDNKKPDSIDYNKIIEQNQYELEKLKVLYSNSQLECNKLKMILDTERKQLITKLEEKSKAAQLQVEQKLSHLELTKQEEIQKMKENISSDIIIAFIDPILLFESSIQNSPKDNPAVSAYLQGYSMIINMFKDKLDSLGVQQIDVRVGDVFNEKFMAAFDVEEAPGIEPNKVIRVVGKGFVLNKKIIKYVSVVVSK